MKFDKTLKEDFEDYDNGMLDLDGMPDGDGDLDDVGFDDGLDDFDSEFNDFDAEVEMTLGEATKLTDRDGSVLLAGPGDRVTIKSPTLKRINKAL